MRHKVGIRTKKGGSQKATTRKEKRKQARKEKKYKKMQFFSKKYGHLQVEQQNSPQTNSPSKPGKDKPRKVKTKELSYADVRKIQLKEANEDEDKSIRKLEKILKLNKRKSKNIPKSFREDGLDYILELIDHPQDLQLSEFDMDAGDTEINDDLSKALGKERLSGDTLDSNSDQEVSDIEDGYGEDFFVNPESEDKQNAKMEAMKTSKFTRTQKGSTPIVVDSGEVPLSDSDSSASDLSDSEHCDFSENKKICLKEAKLNNGEFVPIEVLKKEKENKECEKKPSKRVPNVVRTSASILKKSKFVDNECSETVKRKKQKVVHWEEGNASDFPEESDSNASLDEEFQDPETHVSEEYSKPTNRDKYWEDIYGRLRDKKGNIVNAKETISSGGKYVPPAKRAIPTTDDAKKRETQMRIHKQMRGLLNKLNESNMKHITDQIENLYMQHSRNDMNEALVHLLQQSVVLPCLTPEKLVMEHALLVAVLHCNIGSEVGAHCLQSLVSALNLKLKEGQHHEEGKEIDNLLLLICHLYTFKVTHSILIYDILKILTDSFNEKDVELILLVLRSIGFALRKDNPMELKTLILSVQNKAGNSSHLADQSRVRFMLDSMMAIRNNNMQKIPNYDPTLAEHLRKFLKTLLRKGTYVQELHITLEDLLKAEEKGRWWIVGSAWQGNMANDDDDEEKEKTEKQQNFVHQFSEEVLDLARKQHMNTEVRKNIFCILMSAEDYMDAFEKLLRLGLKNQQDREVIHVSFHCCLQEKEFNPYYPHLLEKFCVFDRKYQMALQFALWDKFREMGKMKPFQVTNLAKCLVHLLSTNALPLSVLKVIQLSEIDKTLVKFLRQVLLAILLHESKEVCQNVFLRIAPAPKLHSMREGLRLFMMHFLLRNSDKLEGHIASQLKERVDLAVKAMTSVENAHHRL